MSQRTLDTIVALLELWPDVNQPSTAADRVQVNETRSSPMLLMDPRWHQGTFRELEEALRWMRKNGRQKAYRGESVATLRWHVRHWWISPVMVRRQVIIRRSRSKGGRYVNEYGPRVVPMRHPEAREQKALWGAEWIDLQWPALVELARREGRPFRSVPQLPPDEMKAAA